jgi:uncharacterized protein (TIGR00369 family)
MSKAEVTAGGDRGLGCAFLNQLPARRGHDATGYSVEIDLTDDLRGPAGSLHGGLVTMLVDVAGATCLAAESGRPLATASTAIEYLSAGRVGPIRATGQVQRVSPNRGVAEVRVVDVGKDERLMAIALVSVTFLDGDTYAAKTD